MCHNICLIPFFSVLSISERRAAIKKAKAGNYYSRSTLVFDKHLLWLMNYVSDLEDAVMVETGVARGGCLALCHLENSLLKIYGFDSWEPMPDCSDKDDIEKCKPWVGTESSGKIEDVEKSYHHLGADNTNLSLVKGWLEDTLPQASYLHRGIDILRIDTDHYQSVFYTLQELYKHVNEGGLIILDDWHFNPKGVRGALNDFSDLLGISFEITIHEEGKGPAYFFKPSTTPQSAEIFPINKNLLQKTLDISISNSRKINGHNDPNFLRIHHNNHHILLYIKDYILKEKCKSV